jgi:AAA+ superfamily predicted ATPase
VTRQRQIRSLQPVNLPVSPASIIRDEVSLPVGYVEPTWAIDLIGEWKKSDALFEVGAYPTQSLLLRGPSGTGKTTSARWIAQQLKLPIFSMSIASTIESYMGASGRNIDAAIRYGLSTPCVLLMDEIDSIAASRKEKRSDVGEIWRITNSLIQSLDSWHAAPGKSLLVATTNMMDGSIDSAVHRRFELQVIVPLPTSSELSKLAGIPWPEELHISQADCRRMILQAKRASVMTGGDYSLILMSMCSNLQTEELAF